MRDYSLPIRNSNQKWPQAAPFTFIRYSEKDHKELLDSWYDQYELQPLDFKEVPNTSWIVYCKGAPLAMASLYLFRDLSEVAMIGGLIAAKDIDSKLRDEAIDAVIRKTEDEAKNRGVTALVAMTRLSAVEDRIISQNYDIMDVGYTRLVKYLDRGEK